MKILGIISDDYGKRHIENVQAQAPPNWEVSVWTAPTTFPLVIDYPEDFLPETLPPADLILAFGEHKGILSCCPMRPR